MWQSPRLVIPNAANKWLTMKNVDLVFCDDRLIVAEGLTLASGKDPSLRSLTGERGRRHLRALERVRIGRVLALADDDEACQDAGYVVLRLEAVNRARFTARFGIGKLILDVDGGVTNTWRWTTSHASPGTVRPTLSDLFGQRFNG